MCLLFCFPSASKRWSSPFNLSIFWNQMISNDKQATTEPLHMSLPVHPQKKPQKNPKTCLQYEQRRISLLQFYCWACKTKCKSVWVCTKYICILQSRIWIWVHIWFMVMMQSREMKTHFSFSDPFHLHIFDVLSPHHFLLLLSHHLLLVFFCYVNSILSSRIWQYVAWLLYNH